jgi:hypothetical protein
MVITRKNAEAFLTNGAVALAQTSGGPICQVLHSLGLDNMRKFGTFSDREPRQ